MTGQAIKEKALKDKTLRAWDQFLRRERVPTNYDSIPPFPVAPSS